MTAEDAELRVLIKEVYDLCELRVSAVKVNPDIHR
jgi:hypothetical protein